MGVFRAAVFEDFSSIPAGGIKKLFRDDVGECYDWNVNFASRKRRSIEEELGEAAEESFAILPLIRQRRQAAGKKGPAKKAKKSLAKKGPAKKVARKGPAKKGPQRKSKKEERKVQRRGVRGVRGLKVDKGAQIGEFTILCGVWTWQFRNTSRPVLRML